MHLHLDLSGGLIGDMFIAAVLDAFPQFEVRVFAAVDALDGPYPLSCSLVWHSNYETTGRRFEVEPFDKYFGYIPFAYPVASHGDAGWHEGATWGSVRGRFDAAEIEPGVRSHAIKIFELLVQAESRVHGVKPESVAFQEVGAWDAVSEIVGAAALIDALGKVHWTVSPLPVNAAVTLMGASILSYLCPAIAATSGLPLRALLGTGNGFGSLRSGSVNSRMRLLWFGDEPRPPPDETMPVAGRAPERAGERRAP